MIGCDQAGCWRRKESGGQLRDTTPFSARAAAQPLLTG